MNTGIERDEKGTYYWIGVIDSASYRKVIRIIYGAIGGLCALFVIMVLAMYPDMLRTTVLSCLGVLAVVSAITIPLMRLSRERQQKYEMNDEYVRFVGYGKSDSYFYYRNIRQVRVHNSRNMIEVKGLAVSAPFAMVEVSKSSARTV